MPDLADRIRTAVHENLPWTDDDAERAADDIARAVLAELENGNDHEAIKERYHRALNAKPSKGPWTDKGIAAICDSNADILALIAENELRRQTFERQAQFLNYRPDEAYERIRSLPVHHDLAIGDYVLAGDVAAALDGE